MSAPALVKVSNDTHWDLYAFENGRLSAIPNESGKRAGCAASHFGDRQHILRLLNTFPRPDMFEGWNELGLATIVNGLNESITQRGCYRYN